MAEDAGSIEQATGSSEPRFGTGPLPTELQRLSWCAFFFPWFWAIRFALWRYLAGYWSLVVLGWFAAAAVREGFGSALLAQVAWVAIEVLIVAVGLWLGIRGNRIAWAAVAARGADVGIGNLTASREAASQKSYLAVGLMFEAWRVFSFFRQSTESGWASPVLLCAQALALAVACYLYLAGGHTSASADSPAPPGD